MADYLVFLEYYLYIAIGFWIINSIVGGYLGEKWKWEDGLDSIFWFLSISTLFGLFIRIITERIKEAFNND